MRFTVAIAILASSSVLRLWGDENRQGWRSWTSDDGMAESYSYTIGVDPFGNAWVRHGAVRSMSRLDGYGVTRLPEPRTGQRITWMSTGRANAVEDGSAWTVTEGQLKEFRDGHWILHYQEEAGGDRLIAAIPAKGRTLVLFSSGLREYDVARRSWKEINASRTSRIGPFLAMTGGDGSIWLTGEQGIARLKMSGGGPEGEWTEVSGSGSLLKFNFPVAGADEVFAQAEALGGKGVVVRWAGAGLEGIYVSEARAPRGWRAPDGSIWILDGGDLFRLVNGQRVPMERTSVLAGNIYDVSSSGNVFWIATTEGVARSIEPLWRNAPGLGEFHLPVHAAAEDSRGRLWFAATDYLLELDGAIWKRHRIPKGLETHTVQTHSVVAMSNGRVLVKTMGQDQTEATLEFDPAGERFRTITHPEGRRIVLIARRRTGGVWAATVGRQPGIRIEVFEDGRFQKYVEIGPAWKEADLRCLLERRNGELWLGGMSGGYGYDGRRFFDPFSEQAGYAESGVFALEELANGDVLAGGRKQVLRYDGKSWTPLAGGLDRVRSILERRDGSVLVSTAREIHRLQDGAWISNGVEEGLPSIVAYLIFEDSRGRLWGGGLGGLALYNPRADKDPPRTLLDAGSNNTEVPPPGDVRFTFSGIDKWKQTSAERLLFSYRLDGEAWSPYRAQHWAAFQGLEAGRHRFEVRAMDRAGNREGQAQSFELIALHPWYRGGTFLSLAGASLALMAGLGGLAVTQLRRRGELIAKLKSAKAEAESAGQRKTELLANMGHEIRTPMSGIIGMTDLALAAGDSVEQREYLETSRQCASALLRTLNDILDFSNVEKGKTELAPENFELRRCVEEGLEIPRYIAEQKGLQFESEVDAEVPEWVHGDAARFRLILISLVGNAVKFTGAGRIVTRVSVELSLDEFPRLHFCIGDTGPGIPDDKQALVFAPFEQADVSLARPHGGTGLGLTISRKLVEMMDGRIWIESPWPDPRTGEKIQGSAFHFTARFERGLEVEAETGAAAPNPIRPMHILVVEDNEVNRRLARRLLERQGHTVIAVSNGHEALAVPENETVDMVFMDLQMPGMDGLETTRRIREKERGGGARMPIIALTAYAMTGDREICLAAGMDWYVSKPVRAEELRRVIAGVTATA